MEETHLFRLLKILVRGLYIIREDDEVVVRISGSLNSGKGASVGL
jgi:hypothetical protein